MKPVLDPFMIQKFLQTTRTNFPEPLVGRSQVRVLLATFGTASLTIVTTVFWLCVIQPCLSTSKSTAHPTSIPWLQNQADCEKTARSWRNGACWDQEHSPDF